MVRGAGSEMRNFWCGDTTVRARTLMTLFDTRSFSIRALSPRSTSRDLIVTMGTTTCRGPGLSTISGSLTTRICPLSATPKPMLTKNGTEVDSAVPITPLNTRRSATTLAARTLMVMMVRSVPTARLMRMLTMRWAMFRTHQLFATSYRFRSACRYSSNDRFTKRTRPRRSLRRKAGKVRSRPETSMMPPEVNLALASSRRSNLRNTLRKVPLRAFLLESAMTSTFKPLTRQRNTMTT
mmetsp:Transcript_11298/g.42171  ORF Transcript_11298/g.42171 Transcript_11298/m.42171 type:complete len:238 (+) Transcript_11298:1259-1972(+)